MRVPIRKGTVVAAASGMSPSICRHRDTGMIERVYGYVLRHRDRRATRVDEVRYEVARVLRFLSAGAAS